MASCIYNEIKDPAVFLNDRQVMFMKQIFRAALCLSVGFLLCGCAALKIPSDSFSEDSETIVFADGKKIKSERFSEFYYTEENINFNAFYQRYRFFTEDGKKMFFHEQRKVENGYGPAGEKDRTAMGQKELSEEEWLSFVGYLKQGTLRKRRDSAESGSTGPWMYLYCQNEDPAGLVFQFSSGGDCLKFEAFCAELAKKCG